MAEPMIGEIKLLPYTFTPRMYYECTGALVTISENSVLYAVIGVNYGGNGRVTLGLPHFEGRAPLGVGTSPGLSYIPGPGYYDGIEEAGLIEQNIPAHTHEVYLSKGASTSASPATDKFLGSAKSLGPGQATKIYTAETTDLSPMSSHMLQSYGISSSYPLHENMQPYQVLRYVIAYDGIFPSRN